MDKAVFDMHIRAGLAYGQESTCGKKQDFKSEETATRVAPKLSAKFGHEMEAYPCAFCSGWHVGREMTAEEREKWSADERPGGFQTTSTEALLVIRQNLIDGIVLVGKRVLAGTFSLADKEGSAPPSQSGWLTLTLLIGVEDELESRIRGFKRAVDPKLVTA